MFDSLKILYHQGKQFIPDVARAKVPGIFRGRPIISREKVNEDGLKELCPVNAITIEPVCIDLGKCTFCDECARIYPGKISFTTDYRISTNEREQLIVKEGDVRPIEVNSKTVRRDIHRVFGRSLKLRQVCAGGDNSCEWELNASNNVQFDMGRFGIEFVASPRHADGIVITGPVSENMAEPLQICYDAIPEPKIIVLVGTDAISGGIFSGSAALDRNFLNSNNIDLYIPGNPAHPLTIINGLFDLMKKR
jgi:Ni,Fe-hydrogenase III small subunit